MAGFTRYTLAVSILCIFLVGCSGTGGDSIPVIPGVPGNIPAADGRVANHYLWNYSLVFVDTTNPENPSWEVVPVRLTSGHLNVLTWLENGPCTDCFELVSLSHAGPGTYNAEIRLTHPFYSANLTGFDVRGICMFNGSGTFPLSGLTYSDRNLGDAELVNPDGYTRLFNASTAGHDLEGYTEGNLAMGGPPDAELNGYKRFVTNDPANVRNAFYVGDSIEVIYEVALPPSELAFGYAVDASYYPPLVKPVTDPMVDFGLDANCPEAWQLSVSVESGLVETGGEAVLTVDVYDWQGKDDAHQLMAECPGLGTGMFYGEWVGDFAGYTRYEITVDNPNQAVPGEYRCLIKKEAAENDPVVKPWLDLSAYGIVTLKVGGNVPDNPVLVTPDGLNFTPEDIAVQGNYAYVAARWYGLQIFDITDVDNPVWVSEVEVAGRAYWVDVQGEYAYVSDYEEGLYVIDIDPVETPEIVALVEDVRGDLEVQGDYVYMVHLDFYVVDCSVPESAHRIAMSSIYYGEGRASIDVDGDYAYITFMYWDPGDDAPYDVFKILNISNPYAPTTEKHIVFDEYYLGTGGVAYNDGFVYLGGNAQLKVLDVDPPDEASVVYAGSGSGSNIEVSDGYVFSMNYGGIKSYRIDPVEYIEFAGEIDLTGGLENSTINGSYAYIANSMFGLQIVDITMPGNMFLAGERFCFGKIFGIDAKEGMAYIVGESQLAMVDISVPEQTYIANLLVIPEMLSHYGGEIVVCGDYAFAGYDDFYVFDISTPDDVQILTTLPLGYYDTTIIDLYPGYAIVNNHHDLHVIDIDTPQSPEIVQTIDLETNTYDIEVHGDYAYACGSPGLFIVDLSTPAEAEVVGTLFGDYGVQVSVIDDYTYLAGESLVIVDTSDPSDPVEIDSIPLANLSTEIEVDETYLYIFATYDSLKIYSIENPEAPVLITSFTYTSWPKQFDIEDGYIYVTHSSSVGLDIIKLW